MNNWLRSILFRAEAHEKLKEMTMTPKQRLIEAINEIIGGHIEPYTTRELLKEVINKVEEILPE